MKHLSVKHLTLIFLFLFTGICVAFSAEEPVKGEKKAGAFNAGEMIIEHIVDAHEWHIMEIGEHAVTVPLPIILWSDGKLTTFMSSEFHHGESAYNGFKLEHEGKNKGKIVKVKEGTMEADE